MANTGNHIEYENNGALWVVVAIIVALALAYAVYATFSSGRYELEIPTETQGSVSSTPSNINQ